MKNDTDVFGFWIYILSDCILFSALFATYAVLSPNVYGGLGMRELTNLPYVFTETMVLLTSSFTFGMAMISLYKNNLKQVMFWLIGTFTLGTGFVGMELNEFIHMVQEGSSWQSSAALSAFFTLVGTHGLHVTIGLIWMLVMMLQFSMFGMVPMMRKRMAYLGLFWAFLDIVWIFVYTLVYLMGAI